MTPRTVSESPSGTINSNDPYSESHELDEESGDEPLPTHTSEIGTLKKLPNHNTAWLGSSSGVYFVNTVRQAFSAAFGSVNNDSAVPPSEDILTGDDPDGQNHNGPIREGPKSEIQAYRHITTSLGRPPPDIKVAIELVTTFFRLWHPLFPFLHGPQFLKDVDDIYASGKAHDVSSNARIQDEVNNNATMQRVLSEHRKFVTFQLIINIASLDRPDIDLPSESRIKSAWDVTQIAGCIAVRHDMDTIQACLAAELYLVATICLRQASTVAGIILKLIYHAGLHRCPLRYAQLSLEDCEIRKRIFWSAYALDRYLSLSLGDPNTVQDSDIDVCLSGKELHKAVARDLVIHPCDEIKMHLPNSSSSDETGASPEDPRVANMKSGPQAKEKQLREAAMTAYVHYGRLTGRVIEIFHKSIHARFPKKDAILYLNSDMEDWWNGLPTSISGEDALNQDDETQQLNHRQLAPFFLILHQQLLLLLNRPRLSLDQSTAEFQHGLQICIKASRKSLKALKQHKENGQSMLLPGLLSAAWMAGLIIAFSCQLGKYPKMRACSEIEACLRILESMGSQKWFTVKNCHKVLSLLLQNINARKASSTGYLSTPSNTNVKNQSESPSSTPASGIATTSQYSASSSQAQAKKRSHPPDEGITTGPSLKRESIHGNDLSSLNPDFRVPLHPASLIRYSSDPSAAGTKREAFDNVATSALDNSLHARRQSPSTMAANAFDSNLGFGSTNASSTTFSPPSLITSVPNPNQDLASSIADDPMFWSNFDMTSSDIFSAASWENMTGYGGPMLGGSMGGSNMNLNFGVDDGMGIGGSNGLASYFGTSHTGFGGFEGANLHAGTAANQGSDSVSGAGIDGSGGPGGGGREGVRATTTAATGGSGNTGPGFWNDFGFGRTSTSSTSTARGGLPNRTAGRRSTTSRTK